MSPHLHPMRLVLAGLVALSGLAAVSPTLAQSRSRRSRVKFTMPRLSYDRGAPSKRGDGASRNLFCTAPAGPVALTPLYSEAVLLSDGTPQLDAQGQPDREYFALTQTSEARPTFALHVPLARQAVADLRLNLLVLDATGDEVYDLPIPVPSRAGIITFQPGVNQPALETGQRYDWMIEVEVACTESDLGRPKYETLTGQIERRAIFEGETLTSKEAFAEIAAARGFWPDAMATVADLHRQDQNNPQYVEDWTALLDSIDLSPLAAEPLLDHHVLTGPLSPSSQPSSQSPSSAPVNQTSSEGLAVERPQKLMHPRLFPIR